MMHKYTYHWLLFKRGETGQVRWGAWASACVHSWQPHSRSHLHKYTPLVSLVRLLPSQSQQFRRPRICSLPFVRLIQREFTFPPWKCKLTMHSNSIRNTPYWMAYMYYQWVLATAPHFETITSIGDLLSMGGACISRGDQHLFDVRRLCEFPGQGMFPSSTTKHKNSGCHCWPWTGDSEAKWNLQKVNHSWHFRLHVFWKTISFLVVFYFVNFYVGWCFACMYACGPWLCYVFTEARRDCWISWN